MGAVLTQRDGYRFKLWQAGLLAIVTLMALGMVRAGASWGSSAYTPASDPYSIQNVEAGDGVTAWWNAGYTGKGVDVALIDTGVAPVAGLSGSGKIVNGPDLSLESQATSLANTRHERPRHVHGRNHRRQRRPRPAPATAASRPTPGSCPSRSGSRTAASTSAR